jgi:hypothetical protein
MDDESRFFVFIVLLIAILAAVVVYGVKSDRDQVREMAEQGYVWVPRIEGHYEKAK